MEILPADQVKHVSKSGRRRKQLRSPNPVVRARLLEAGNALIEIDSGPDLRVDEVAERAGVSVGTFYLYFEGKQDLLTAMVVDYTERCCTVRERALSAAGEPKVRMLRGLNAYVDFVEQNQKGFLYCKAIKNIETNAGDLSSWVFSRHAECMIPVLEEGMRTGAIANQNLELLTQSIIGLTQHMLGFWLNNNERITREQIVGFILNSIRVMVKNVGAPVAAAPTALSV
jgi:AcrR family transcriptional regulator